MAVRWKKSIRDHQPIILIGLVWLIFAGCSGSKLKTFPVNGKFEMADGDVSSLSGCIVEFMQQADPMVRSNGAIGPDGTFKMETLYEGEIVSGAPEGVYSVRIILTDEDADGDPRPGGMPVHRRFLDFKTSTWTVTVPGDSITLKVTKS